jgi:hypothetical protein
MIREAFEYVLGDVEVARVEMKFVLAHDHDQLAACIGRSRAPRA